MLKFVSLVFLCGLLTGCASREWMAERAAAEMLDPATPPREELRLRQQLIALAPDSDALLAGAFFPIGLYDVPEEALAEVAAAGFNLVVNGANEPAYLARAQALGLRVIPYVDTQHMAADVARASGSAPAPDALLQKAAARALFAWYLFDEPDLNGISAEDYLVLSKELRRVEKSRPIFLTVLLPENYSAFVAGCDILAPNSYPIQEERPERNNLRRVAEAVQAARAAAGARPVWAILQAFYAPPIWPRNPTPQELRAMVFLALNHGASGVIYFSYKSGDRPITRRPELFPAVERLNGQLNALRSALLAPPMEKAVSVQVVEERIPAPATWKVPEGREPVDCSLRPFLGAHLLITVNPDPWKKTARLILPETVAAKRAEEWFGDPDPAAPDKSCLAAPPAQPLTAPSSAPLELPFEPYQVRIFWIR